MFALIITIHVIACICLIFIVLVQQGKGGGLIDSLSSAESIFGTKTSSFLVKATTVASIVFFLTCLSLAFLSIQRNKSLLETVRKNLTAPSQSAATTGSQKPVDTPQTPGTAASQTTSAVNQQLPERTSEQAVNAVAEGTAAAEKKLPLTDEVSQTAITPEVSATHADLTPADPEKTGQ